MLKKFTIMTFMHLKLEILHLCIIFYLIHFQKISFNISMVIIYMSTFLKLSQMFKKEFLLLLVFRNKMD